MHKRRDKYKNTPLYIVRCGALCELSTKVECPP